MSFLSLILVISRQVTFLSILGAFLLSAITLSGCGALPGAKPSPDSSVLNLASYHQNNGQCEQVDLSQSNFAPASLRSLARCLNTSGVINATNDLIQSSRDEELAPLTEAVHRLILTQPRRLHEIDQTIQSLDRSGDLATIFNELSPLMRNGAFVTASIHALNQGYFSNTGGILGYVNSLINPTPNGRVLKALEVLGPQLTNDGIAQAIDFALTAADARVFQSLQTYFTTSQNESSPVSLNTIVGSLVDLLNTPHYDPRSSQNFDLGKEFLTLAADGSLWSALDQILPNNDPQWHAQVRPWANLLSTLYRDHGRFFSDTPTLFEALEQTRETPVTCLRNTAQLITLSPQQVFSELNHLNLKEFLSGLIAIRPFCDFPQAILSGSATYMPLAISDAAPTMESWVRAFNTDPRLTEFMIRMLRGRESALSSQNRLRRLEPLVSELTRRGVLADAFLFLSLPRITDRTRLQDALRILIAPRETLNGQSVYDVLSDVARRTNVADLVSLFRALQPFIDQNEVLVSPLIRSLRTAFYINDSHPLLDLARDILGNATQNQNLLTALFKIVARNPVLFSRSVSEIAALSQRSDGRMRELSLSVLNVFRPYARAGQYAIASHAQPPFQSRARHNLVGSDLPPLLSRPSRPDAIRACTAYDFQFSLADYNAPQFTEQFRNFAECIAFTDRDLDAERSLQFITNQTLFTGSLQGRSLFSWTVDLVSNFARSTLAVSELADRFLAATRDQRLNASLNALPFWVDPQESLLDPLLGVLSSASRNSRPALASTNTHSPIDLTGKTAQVCTSRVEEDGALPVTTCESLPVLEAIRRQLAQWEPQADVATRTAEIIAEFSESIESDFNSDQDRITQQNRLITQNNNPLLLKRISKVHNYLINPRSSEEDPTASNNHKALEGLLLFAKGINAAFNPFYHDLNAVSLANNREGTLAVIDFMTAWMVEQANTLSVITYYYRGMTEPRVRLVSNLDRLGLTLENSDALASSGFEPAILGLQLSSAGWMDEAEEDRPVYDPERREYITLEDVVATFVSGVSEEYTCLNPANKPESEYTSDEKVCIGRYRNLKGVLHAGQSRDDFPQTLTPSLVSLLRTYLPVGATCSAPTDCFGVKMIRNLFSAIQKKTPLAFQEIMGSRGYVGSKSNFKTMIAIAKTGVFRKGTLLLWGKDAQSPDLKHFFRSLVILAQSPEFSLIETLLKDILSPQSDRGEWTEETPREQRGLARRLFDTAIDVATHDSDAASQLAYYGAAGLSSLHINESPTNIIGPVVKTLTGAVQPGAGREILMQNMGAIRTMLSAPFLAATTQALFEDSVRPSGSQWSLFRTRLQNIQSRPEYPLQDLNRLSDPIIEFLYHPPRGNESGAELYRQILTTLLQDASEGHTDALLRFISQNPQDVSNLVSTLARFRREGHVIELTDMLGRFLFVRGPSH